MNLSIPKDAFSDGQVRSKLWLANSLNEWGRKYFTSNTTYTLNWYGSWVGLGPFLLLSLTDIKFSTVNLIELDDESLKTSRRILDYWICEGVQINTFNENMNHYLPQSTSENQLFVNTACEHVLEIDWIKRIPTGAKILLQSTDMTHTEHINSVSSLAEFKTQMNPYFSVKEINQLDVSYPNMSFSRFMLFGVK